MSVRSQPFWFGLLSLLLLAAPVWGQTLAGESLTRRGQLGVFPVAVTQATYASLGLDAPRGTAVQQVQPGSTAEALGLVPGDVILALDGQSIDTPQALIASLAPRRAGTTVQLTLWRDGREETRTGTLRPRPLERSAQGEVTYDEVPFRGGHLRTLLLRPTGAERPPVVFFLPGYPCQSVDYGGGSGSVYKRFIDGWAAQGLAVFRVEKPGVGDSQGPASCTEGDFETERAAFAAGYRFLLDQPDLDLDRVFLFGHSMGGILAPLLAEGVQPPRGIIVYGTVLQNWHDYMLDLLRLQPLLLSDADPGALVARADTYREGFRRFFFGKETPDALLADPTTEAAMREGLSYQGHGQILGRHYTFWQDLADLNLAASWSQAGAPVLALYGESDIAALHDEDHRRIAAIVDRARPGQGTFEVVPRTNHSFVVVGTPEEHRQHHLNGTLQSLQHNINTDLIDRMARWMQAQGGASSTPPRPSAAGQATKPVAPTDLSLTPWTLVPARLPAEALAGRSMDVEYGDLDGDGDVDLVVANEWGPNLVLRNDGTGRFSAADNPVPVKSNDTEDIAVADFDGNGTLDLVLVSEDNQEHEYYLNDGALGLTDVSDRLALRTTANAVLALDADADGDVDLLLGNAGQNSLLLNDGTGHFTDVTASHLPARIDVTQDVEAGDLNGDGLLDLVVGNEDQNRLLLGLGAGRFEEAPAEALPIRLGREETREADLADVDGDGDLDLLFANVDFQTQTQYANRLLLNDGTGHFTDVSASHLADPPGHTLDADFADVDRDGDLDLLLGYSFGRSLAVLLNDGTGRFADVTEAVLPNGVVADVIDLEVIDLDGAGGRVLYVTHFQGADLLLTLPAG
ncbi:MAG: alpha/beta fold hydrolase [Bacteroidota bacterium]